MKHLPVPTAKEINDAHREAIGSAETAIKHAVRCGELLLAKKADLQHGEFQEWVGKHCVFAYSTGVLYIKAAKTNRLAPVEVSAIRKLFPSGNVKNKHKPKQGVKSKSLTALEICPTPEDAPAPAKKEKPASKDEPGKSNSKPFENFAEYTPDEAEEEAALERAAAEVDKSMDAVMASDDRFPALKAEIKRLAGLLSIEESSRIHYQNISGEAARYVKARDQEIKALRKKLEKAQSEIEKLTERIAIMKAS